MPIIIVVCVAWKKLVSWGQSMILKNFFISDTWWASPLSHCQGKRGSFFEPNCHPLSWKFINLNGNEGSYMGSDNIVASVFPGCRQKTVIKARSKSSINKASEGGRGKNRAESFVRYATIRSCTLISIPKSRKSLNTKFIQRSLLLLWLLNIFIECTWILSGFEGLRELIEKIQWYLVIWKY